MSEEITWVTVKIWIGEQFLFYNVRIPFQRGLISIDPLDERLEKITSAVQEVFQQQMGLPQTKQEEAGR